ncbi:chromosome segregation protein SMC [Thermovibrio ammonificans HB-1]|uniref:Chromosome partition protein Smc n=1 Tax=Thermovibrio ammonificans (strain DSM 15698 / JCM 12110 / HB-1) TaxID=648996 RepID=E8T354_THEA1|nr:chromosome segregation protein SMC [Thermovibrio ammonificans]ADU96059.1 chromosome segregation protein SMC [Thermovibrio ammonificans HB-1]
MIRSLKLKGFKSFADETEIRFSEGINCIVGPNGCGKSNIVDALKWVVGGTSPKGMRADSIKDVIFKGAQGRRPARSAEVAVTVAAEDLFSAASLETEVKRRVTADGDSQFFINGKKVRLKDIQELFTNLGLSNRDYAFFEQGQVDRVLRMRPAERRALIDEAAGITPFKEKREETLKQLGEAQANLESVRGVIDEVAKNLRALKNQAEKAQKFQELRTRERRLELALLGCQLKAVQEEKARLEGSIKVLQEDRASLEREVSRIEVELQELRSQLEQLSQELEETTKELHEVEKSKKEAAVKRDFLEKEIKRLKSEIEERSFEKEQKLKKLSLVAAEIEELRSLEGSLKRELAGFEEKERQLLEEVKKLEAEVKKLQSREVELGRKLSALNAQETKLKTDLAREEERFNSFKNFLDRFPKELETLERELSYYLSQVERVEGEVEQFKAKVEELQEKLNLKKQEREELLLRLDEERERLEEKRRQVLKLKAEIENTKNILSSIDLGKLEAKIVESAKKGKVKGFVGLLINLIEVEPGYEKVVENYLSRFGAGIVVDNFKTVSWIGSKIKGNGRVWLFPKSVKGLKTKEIEGATPLSAVVKPKEEGLKPLLLNLFHNVYYAPGRAAQLAEEHPDCLFIDEGGSIYSAKGCLVGNFKGSSLLELERRLKEKEELLKILQRELKELEKGIEPLKQELLYLEDSIEELKEELSAAKMELFKRETSLKEFKKRLGEVEKRKEELLARRERAQENVESFNRRKALFENKLQELTKERKKLLSEQEELKSELMRLQERLDALKGELSELRTQRATLLEKLKAVKEKREAKERFLRTVQREIEEAERRVEQLKKDLEKAISARERAVQLLSGVDETIEEIKADINSLKGRREELYAVIREKEAALKQKKADLAAVSKNLKESEIKLAKLSVQEEELLKKILDLDSTPTEALSLASEVEDQEELKRELINLKERISRLGAVNLLAIEEYEKVKERYGFILEQEKDLVESIKNLKEAIKKLDQEIEKRFFETFRQVDRSFRATVKKVFGGGSGRLILTSQDLSEAGLEIEVKPPGKRHGSINLLSGGEKTLVALAFLYALYRVRPAPFVVLDEVDAALDDANTLRFTELLKEMANETQVIIITHNKLTMEAADVIYGVTMEVPGISKVIGVSFEALQREPVTS